MDLIIIMIILAIIFVLSKDRSDTRHKPIKTSRPNQDYERSSYKRASNVSFEDAFNDKGYNGEYEIFEVLRKVRGIRRIIVNAYIPTDNKGNTTEIDLILIHETGIYVIESKNYSGWIFGDENNKNWMQMLNKHSKQPFYNPIWQNNTHIKYLNNFLNDIDTKYFRSLIVFGERCSIKKMNVESKNVTVIKYENLISTLNTMMKNSSLKLSLDDVETIYSRLKPFTLKTEREKLVHIENIKRNITK